jgi:DNA-binding CsgD family transcriptional regulator
LWTTPRTGSIAVDLQLCGFRLVELLEGYSNQTIILGKLQRLFDLPQRDPTSDRRPVRKQTQHRLTADEQRELIERYLEGQRAYQLAEALHVNRSTVSRLLADVGIRRPRSLTPDEIAECVELYAQGWSCQRIGQRLGRDHGTIWLALKTQGVKLRDTQGRERP